MPDKTNNKPIITREMYENYVKVQVTGVTNMLSTDVQRLAHITEEEHLEIMRHYNRYSKKFNIKFEDFDKDKVLNELYGITS